MEISASFSRGHVAYHHDVREGILPKNVDPELSKYNVIFRDRLQGKSIEDYTDERMQPFIDEYNAKQKRKDRRITTGYSDWHKLHSKSGCPLVYETVFQLGDHETLGKLWYDTKNHPMAMWAFFKRECEEFIQMFEHDHPHLEIVWATLHCDEPAGTPHLHVAFQPIGEGYKQGLAQQVSIGRALTLDGIERVEKRADAEELGGYQLQRLYNKMVNYGKNRILSKNVEKLLSEPVELKETVHGRDHLEPERYAWRAQKAKKKVEEEKTKVEEEITDLNRQKECVEDTLLERITELNAISAQVENDTAKDERLQAQIKEKTTILDLLDKALKEIIPRWINAYRALNKRLEHYFTYEKGANYTAMIDKLTRPMEETEKAVQSINKMATNPETCLGDAAERSRLEKNVDTIKKTTEMIEEMLEEDEDERDL